jgi:hypothetical protein
MDKKKLERLERRVLRCDAQQAVEKKLELHPTFPDDEEDEEDEEDEDEEVDEDGEEIVQFLTLRLRGCEHHRENHLPITNESYATLAYWRSYQKLTEEERLDVREAVREATTN